MAQVILHTITAVRGEAFDSLALVLYGNEKYASELLLANPNLCHKIIFDGGEVLNVPQILDEAINPLPPWKQSA
jgi:hypothetical protein